MEGSPESVLFALHGLDDPRLRAADQGWRCSPRSPHVAPERGEEGLRLARAVELEVDHDVVRIVGGSEDPVAAYTRPLPVDRIAVEGRLPGVEVADLVLDPQVCILPPLLGAKPSVWGPAVSRPERPAEDRVSLSHTLALRPRPSPAIQVGGCTTTSSLGALHNESLDGTTCWGRASKSGNIWRRCRILVQGPVSETPRARGQTKGAESQDAPAPAVVGVPSCPLLPLSLRSLGYRGRCAC